MIRRIYHGRRARYLTKKFEKEHGITIKQHVHDLLNSEKKKKKKK